MHGDVAGVIVSVIFIAIGYVIHTLIGKKDAFLARKVLHIYICNWFFIYERFFENYFVAIVGLLALAGINLLLEIMFFHTHRYGTVYYPLSIIVLLCFYESGMGSMACVGCGILSMGYGDGFAAIIGKKIKSYHMPLVYEKTVLGSLTMMLVTTAIVLIFTKCGILKALVIGFITSLLEAYIPLGLDNISVPIAVFLLVAKIC